MTEFEKIFLENKDMIYRLLLKLSGNPSVAEELLEEAFSRGYMNFSSLRDKGKISVWLCQIAKNLYFAFYNEQKKYLLTVQKTRRMKLPTKQNCDTFSC